MRHRSRIDCKDIPIDRVKAATDVSISCYTAIKRAPCTLLIILTVCSEILAKVLEYGIFNKIHKY